MEISVDIWLRGENHATTEVISAAPGDPRSWTDGDVATVLEEMLRTLDRAKNPGADPQRPIALRGFSWIVNPFESGGVLIALELSLGAVVAGPFDIPESKLTAMISRVVESHRSVSQTVH
jgi:hypothetical protein